MPKRKSLSKKHGAASEVKIKNKKRDLKKIKEFLNENPTLWGVVWAFLWRSTILWAALMGVVYLFLLLTLAFVFGVFELQ
jgi:hypothetical protein